MAYHQIRLYLDENLSPEITTQLQLHGIDVMRGPLGQDDIAHLEGAGDLGRVICTEDEDLLSLHDSGVQHAGIIKGLNTTHSIGDWVKFLRFLHSVCTADEMRNTVEFVFRID